MPPVPMVTDKTSHHHHNNIEGGSGISNIQHKHPHPPIPHTNVLVESGIRVQFRGTVAQSKQNWDCPTQFETVDTYAIVNTLLNFPFTPLNQTILLNISQLLYQEMYIPCRWRK